MKKYVLFLIFSGCATAYAATPIQWINGQIYFATASVSGFNAYTVAEKNDLISQYGSGSVVNYQATFFEVALSTTLSFNSADDFRNTLTSKPVIADLIASQKGGLDSLLLQYLDLQTRYPAFSALLTNKIKKVTAQIDLLVALFATL